MQYMTPQQENELVARLIGGRTRCGECGAEKADGAPDYTSRAGFELLLDMLQDLCFRFSLTVDTEHDVVEALIETPAGYTLQGQESIGQESAAYMMRRTMVRLLAISIEDQHPALSQCGLGY